MARPKSVQHITLENVKKEAYELLSNFEKINFMESDIYIITTKAYNELLQLEAKLKPYYEDTARKKVFTIYNFLNVINRDYVALKYSFTVAKKSVLISNREKVLERLDSELFKSVERINKYYEKFIEDNEDLSPSIVEELLKEKEEKIQEEYRGHDEVKNNPGKFIDMKISTYEHSKNYPQVNISYFQDNERKMATKHISIEKPNVIIYDDSQLDKIKYRSDMQIADYIKCATRAFGNVYVVSK